MQCATICLSCRKELPLKRRADRRYCGPACRTAAYRQRREVAAPRAKSVAVVHPERAASALEPRFMCQCCGSEFTLRLIPRPKAAPSDNGFGSEPCSSAPEKGALRPRGSHPVESLTSSAPPVACVQQLHNELAQPPEHPFAKGPEPATPPSMLSLTNAPAATTNLEPAAMPVPRMDPAPLAVAPAKQVNVNRPSVEAPPPVTFQHPPQPEVPSVDPIDTEYDEVVEEAPILDHEDDVDTLFDPDADNYDKLAHIHAEMLQLRDRLARQQKRRGLPVTAKRLYPEYKLVDQALFAATVARETYLNEGRSTDEPTIELELKDRLTAPHEALLIRKARQEIEELKRSTK